MNINLFNFLEDEASQLAALAQTRLAEERPAAAAALGTSSEATYARLMDAFIEVSVSGQRDAWDAVAQELVRAEWADPGALIDLPLGLLRTVCDRLVEVAQSDATRVELGPHSLSALEQAGQDMACRLVELYQAHLAKQRDAASRS